MKLIHFLKQKNKGLKKKWKLARNSYFVLRKLGSAGKGCEIKGKIYISKKENLFLGRNVHIGDNAYFKTEGEIHIGDNCHFSRNITIYSVNHNYEGKALPYDNTTIKKKVIIGKNVWLGMNVNIVPGVEIGDGVIIGMGSTVTKNVPELAIVGGNPARIIKYRNKEHYDTLENNKQYGGSGGKPLTE
ncbi:acyltransferase [Flavobacterium sp. XGLA_31]|uniref:acyltransferase n=1 Tax=Flavobacterium sp. XGLA_31 TaxID=3447666 RepID=UPI003F2A40CE